MVTHFSLLALSFLIAVGAAPNYWGCQNDVARALPYCDESLSIDQRVQDLRSRLTLKEKIALISPQPSLGNVCADHTAAVDRIGLPQYMWLVETNTDVSAACVRQEKCATQFAGPLATAASFNRSSWYAKGQVIGTEQRAFANLNWFRTFDRSSSYIGLTAYGPNINQQRDPRFGRSSELPGEDPFLSGQYATHMVRGMQERDRNGYPKVLAYLKHFTAYSRETDRGRDTYNISTYDLFDTYLPQYEVAFVEGNATGAMCSYNGVNGAPSCANSWLLNDVVRRKWNRPDAHITTDCGAVQNLLHEPVRAANEGCAAAYAIMNGTDVEMGSTIWTDHLLEAVRLGVATEEAVDQALTRSYRPHFVAGRFDNPARSEWSALGVDHINSTLHQQIQLEAALQGLVLLKHDRDHPALPLKRGRTKVAVLGPLGQTRSGLMSDYADSERCFGGGYDCVPTLAESIRAINDGCCCCDKGLTTSASGVDVDSNKTEGIDEALLLGKDANVVVLCLGITKDQEHEGMDRQDTSLPGIQEEFAQLVFDLGKPVVLVLVNGGQVALDNLVTKPVAIIEAFNPNAIGGTALAMSLFGLENRWGKLPYTLYPYSAMQSFDMKSYDMSEPPGRTYRYFAGDPVFPFGYGLSMTTFEIRCFQEMPPDGLNFACTVSNTGDYLGDEVLQVYHSASSDIVDMVVHPVPRKHLVDFSRVRVHPGEMASVEFAFDESVFWLVNENGDKVLYPGKHTLAFTNGALPPVEFSFELPLKSLSTVIY
jgi:beta-D-xylosidase 4